jgi:hypothetical protein
MTSADSPAERARENIVGITSVLVTGIWMGAMFTGQEWWLAALLVGYVAVVPIVAMVFGDDEDVSNWWEDDRVTTTHREDEPEPTDDTDAESTDDALQTLRERYARGELTDEQFERKLERLLEVETVEDLEHEIERSREQRANAQPNEPERT